VNLSESLLPPPNPDRTTSTARYAIPMVLLATLAGFGLWIQNSSWAFLHPVRTTVLVQSAEAEMQTNWAVRNDGIARKPFVHAEDAAQWAALNAQAAVWFDQEQRKRKNVDLEKSPNTYWRVVLLDARRRDSIGDVILQVAVRVEGIDCYSKKITAANCPGYPASAVDTTVRLTMKHVDGAWVITAVKPVLRRTKRPTDPMLWLCLANADEAKCGKQNFTAAAAADS